MIKGEVQTKQEHVGLTAVKERKLGLSSLSPWPLSPACFVKHAAFLQGYPDGSDGKEYTRNAADLGSIPGWEDPWRREHCSALAWRIPWTEEPGGLQSMGS